MDVRETIGVTQGYHFTPFIFMDGWPPMEVDMIPSVLDPQIGV